MNVPGCAGKLTAVSISSFYKLLSALFATIVFASSCSVNRPDVTTPSASSSAATKLQIAKVLRVGGMPSRLAVNPSTDRLYVTQEAGALNNLTVVDIRTLELMTRVPGVGAGAIGVDPSADRVYAPSPDGAFLLTIDGSSNQTLRRTALGSGPHDGLVVASDGVVYVTNGGEDQTGVSAIDGSSGRSRFFATELGPSALTADGVLYVALVDAGTSSDPVLVVDRQTLQKDRTFSVGRGPASLQITDLAYDRTGAKLYVLLRDFDTESGQVLVLDTATGAIDDPQRLPSLPNAIALDESAGRLYISNYEGGSVWILDTRSLTLRAEVPVGKQPSDLLFDTQSGRLFVALAGEGSLAVMTAS